MGEDMPRSYIRKAAEFQIEILRNLILDEDQIPDSVIHEEMCSYRNLNCNHPEDGKCPRQTCEDALRIRLLTLDFTSQHLAFREVSLIEALRSGSSEAFDVVRDEILQREKVGATP